MVAASTKTNSLRCLRAFTLIELLVVVAIIALLVAILVPALNEARSVAKRAVCATNIHGLLLGVHTYFNDHNEIPGGSNYQEEEMQLILKMTMKETMKMRKCKKKILLKVSLKLNKLQGMKVKNQTKICLTNTG